MPNINVIYWNLEHFGKETNQYKLTVGYEDRCRVIAHTALNTQADIICITEIMGLQSGYDDRLKTLQSQLNLVYNETGGVRGNWHFDYVKGALKDDANIVRDANSYYDPTTQMFATKDSLEFSGASGSTKAKSEGYAVFWNQNVAKFSMQMPPKVKTMDLVSRALDSESKNWVDNQHSFGVVGLQKFANETEYKEGESLSGNIEYTIFGACTLPVGTQLPADGDVVNENGQVLISAGTRITGQATAISAKATIPKGTLIGKAGVEYQYEDGQDKTNTLVIIPGNYVLMEDFTLPWLGTLVPKHCLSLVLEGRKTTHSDSTLPQDDHSFWWKDPNSNNKWSRFWHAQDAAVFDPSDPNHADTWSMLAFPGEGYTYDESKYHLARYAKKKKPIYNFDATRKPLANNMVKNTAGNLIKMNGRPTIEEISSRTFQTAQLRTRRPSFCTIKVNDGNGTLLPLLIFHTPNSVARINTEKASKKPFGNRIVTYSRNLYQAFDHALENDNENSPGYVYAPGVIGGDFNLNFYDPELATVTTSFKKSDYDGGYATGGANCNVLLPDPSGSDQFKTSVSGLKNNFTDLEKTDPRSKRSHQNDNICYSRGISTMSLNAYHQFLYGNIDHGNVYDLLLAVMEYPEKDDELKVVIGDSQDKSDDREYFKSNFPQIPKSVLNPFLRKDPVYTQENLSGGYTGTYVNPMGLAKNRRFFDRTGIKLTGKDAPKDPVNLSAATQSANFIKKYISDHLPVTLPMTFDAPNDGNKIFDRSKVVIEAENYQIRVDTPTKVFVRLRDQANKEVINPYLTVTLATSAGQFDPYLDSDNHNVTVATWNSTEKAYETTFKFTDHKAPDATIYCGIDGRSLLQTSRISLVKDISLTKSKMACASSLYTGAQTSVLLTLIDTDGLALAIDKNAAVAITIASGAGTISATDYYLGSVYKATYSAPESRTGENIVTFRATYNEATISSTATLSILEAQPQ